MAIRPAAGPRVSRETRTAHHPLAEVVRRPGGRTQPSRFAGAGQEFLDHRNFHHGDDLRAVNWRAYMRLEKLFLKMFQVEPRVPVRLLIDTSASMTAHGGGKFEYARKLAGALCYVGLVRLDTIEIHGFASRLTQRVFCERRAASLHAA